MATNVPAGLKYSKEHEWVKTEGNVATIGITDHAQHALGDIVFVELPKVSGEAKFMKPIGVVESVKAASDIFSPVSGKVTAINSELTKTPESINSDCYGSGWIVKIELTAPDELSKLLDAAGYTAYLATL
jgi:glycine cleavage system H protein